MSCIIGYVTILFEANRRVEIGIYNLILSILGTWSLLALEIIGTCDDSTKVDLL